MKKDKEKTKETGGYLVPPDFEAILAYDMIIKMQSLRGNKHVSELMKDYRESSEKMAELNGSFWRRLKFLFTAT